MANWSMVRSEGEEMPLSLWDVNSTENDLGRWTIRSKANDSNCVFVSSRDKGFKNLYFFFSVQKVHKLKMKLQYEVMCQILTSKNCGTMSSVSASIYWCHQRVSEKKGE